MPSFSVLVLHSASTAHRAENIRNFDPVIECTLSCAKQKYENLLTASSMSNGVHTFKVVQMQLVTPAA